MMTQTQFKTLQGFTVFAALVMCIFIGISAPASADTAKAESFVQTLGAEALSTLEVADSDKQVIANKIRVWLNNYFDKDAIARFALGRNWRNASDSQKKEYTDVFEKMIVLTYSQRLAEYSGEKFEVTGNTKINSRDTMVHSMIIPNDANAPKTRVDWRVRDSNGKMRIVDVVVEGVSMSVTQRADFDAAIQREGGDLDKFIKTLRSKTE